MSNSEQTQRLALPSLALLFRMYSPKPAAFVPAPTASLRDVFDRQTLAVTKVRLDGHQAVYGTGDEDDALYLVESGQVKLSMASEEGKDCLLAIYGTGEIFGESCFHPSHRRHETATTMQFTVLRRAARRELFHEAVRAGAVDAVVHHLASRLIERESAIFDLITNHSEQRLARVLLAVGEKLGKPQGAYLQLEKISHEELSQIVGTTRPRITAFMQRFRSLGLIQTVGRTIHVHRQRTRAFLAHE